MRTAIPYLLTGLLSMTIIACQPQQEPEQVDTFQWQTEQIADLKILRYQIPAFEELSLQEKQLCYYLYEAALSGRDIIYDQNFKHNLLIRKTLEAIYQSWNGDKKSADWIAFEIYLKRVWFSNGIHHHYGMEKFEPGFSQDFFQSAVIAAKNLPLEGNQTSTDLANFLTPILFDTTIASKKVNKDEGMDFIVESAVNFYEGVNTKEVEKFYSSKIQKNDTTPISWGLNSKLVKEKGKLVEKIWKENGMYGPAISRIIYWLEKASTVALSEQQKKTIDLLIQYYKTGDLKKFDEYSIAWVSDTSSRVDFINGFIETYNDPLTMRANYESVVSIKDLEASKRIEAIAAQAQWFEDNSPIMDQHKKKKVTGISARVITVVAEAGDAAPSTPIGINLPNATWIRKYHGSKSVNLGNIVHAYNESGKSSGMLEEFCYNEEEIELARKYASLTNDLHTDMHEVIGHASGQAEPGVGTPRETLKNYASTIEEARADLVALYYIMDQKLVDMGVMPSLEAGKAEYNSYIRNGLLTQLSRVKLGDQLEEDHMRNRQMVANWAYQMGAAENVISETVKDGKTYFVINDYDKLRTLFGDLLRETQRISSTGDYEGAKNLVETYGVKVDQEVHKEVLERYATLKIAPYAGFIQPKLVPLMTGDQITDVKVEYPTDFAGQMLEFSAAYSFLPVKN